MQNTSIVGLENLRDSKTWFQGWTPEPKLGSHKRLTETDGSFRPLQEEH